MEGRVQHQPLLSTRISLAWPPQPPFETTDTLVFSGRTGWYMDFRVFVRGERKGQLDWASAGLKEYTEDSTPERPKARFTPSLDLRGIPPSFGSYSEEDNNAGSGTPTADEGSFTTLSNGDVLETGSMSNPDAAGRVQPYEEVWRRLPTSLSPHVFIAKITTQSYVAFIARFDNHIEMVITSSGPKTSRTQFYAHVKKYSKKNNSWEVVHEVGSQESVRSLPNLKDLVHFREGHHDYEGLHVEVLENSGLNDPVE